MSGDKWVLTYLRSVGIDDPDEELGAWQLGLITIGHLGGGVES